jgi:hypothetical protein
MDQSFFDINTNYLKNPPPFVYPTFDEFKNFYSAHESKEPVIKLLVNYCKSLSKEGIDPFSIIIGGEFLKNESSSTCLKLALCVHPSKRMPPGVVAKQCSNLVAKLYKNVIYPVGQVVVNDHAPTTLADIVIIQELHKDHNLAMILNSVGLICLNFNEVIV